MVRENPFAVVSPEEMDAKLANSLFVDMYSEYPEISRPGNMIIFGARGCGKSMLIRCSRPDVLSIRNDCDIKELPYIAFCLSAEKTNLNLQELNALTDKHAPYLLNEHFMVIHLMRYVFLDLSRIGVGCNKEELQRFKKNIIDRKLKAVGEKRDIEIDLESTKAFFESIYYYFDGLVDEFVSYLRGIIRVEGYDYSYNDMPIMSFNRFVIPVFEELRKLSCFKEGQPFFLFFDDADNLSEIQTKILNTWLASRTQPLASIKISTQWGLYKTFLTTNGVLIESPHDYQEVNISYLYTTRKDEYYKKAKDILEKRLNALDINVTAEEFFPTDKKQDAAIQKEIDSIKNKYATEGRGYSVSDDVRRYAIPNYIKKLGNTSKSRFTYKYAGMENIVHLSSGIIRYLLDSVALMYDEEESQQKDKSRQILQIRPSTQNMVMRKQADKLLFNDLRKSKCLDEYLEIVDNPKNLTDKLTNLINAMGKTFYDILVSDRSERKVFSVAFTNNPDDEIRRVFEYGVQLGFFHETYIGNKEGDGRTWLYVLNRGLAPVFHLDPTGFTGYLFMTNDDLRTAINNGKRLRKVDNKKEKDISGQITIEDYWESVYESQNNE